MNWSKAPPTEPGNYWTKDEFGNVRTRYVWRTQPGILASHYCGAEWWRPIDNMGFTVLWGDRIEFPAEKPVPVDVMESARWLRDWLKGSCLLGDHGVEHARRICDYIDPPKELLLKKPEWVPATFEGKKAYASAIADSGTYFVTTGVRSFLYDSANDCGLSFDGEQP